MKGIFHKRTIVIAVCIVLYLNIAACTSRQVLTRVHTKADFTNSFGMGFNKILAGTFMMGSPDNEPGREENETLHQVTLTKSYYIQTPEITQGQWKAIMGNKPSKFKNCGYDCPVECVSWYDIEDFIEKLNKKGEGKYRLPTEAEWEYAARAGTTTPFNSGNSLSVDEAKFNSNNETTLPVASFKPNAWGLHDMHGNVLEWVQDTYGDYPSEPVTDPKGPATDSRGFSMPLYRGGNLYAPAEECRSASRTEYPFSSYLYLCGTAGFRLVLEQIPQ